MPAQNIIDASRKAPRRKFTALLAVVYLLSSGGLAGVAPARMAAAHVRLGNPHRHASMNARGGAISPRRHAHRTYEEASLAIAQIPAGRLSARPLPPDSAYLLYRAVFGRGAAWQCCASQCPPNDSHDAFIRAMLNEPSPETQAVIDAFGLPPIEGVPPVALLAHRAPPLRRFRRGESIRAPHH
jgi:hypothetical protein